MPTVNHPLSDQAPLSTWKLVGCVLVLIGLIAAFRFVSPTQAAYPPEPDNFIEIAPVGLGDPLNSAPWSMQWWDGYLYVGTVRSFTCWMWAAFGSIAPGLPQPAHCPEDVRDLNLQAEIWRYSPATMVWERVYQSPAVVPDPTQPGRMLTREVGFRDMAIFTEADGTETLYVSSVFPHVLKEEDPPPPRLLRSTDGVTFTEVDPGVTGLGVTTRPSFSRIEIHQGRFYIVEGTIRGDGTVWESETPEAGMESFRKVTPDTLSVFELASYNDALYLGINTQVVTPTVSLSELPHGLPTTIQGDDRNGYAVVKMDTSGPFPYTLIPIVEEGAYLPVPSQSVVSMEQFEDGLYVGTNTPPEIIRINPDDSWDLIVGDPRQLPDGTPVTPRSGLGSGFGWKWNIHVWRMQSHDSALYAGTLDISSSIFDPTWPFAPVDEFGFDLYSSEDGWHFSQITNTGLNQPTQIGLRTFASTDQGLYVGSLGPVEGLRIWLLPSVMKTYLPLVADNAGTVATQESVRTSKVAGTIGAPVTLEEDALATGTLLSWETVSAIDTYDIYRAFVGADKAGGAPPAEPTFQKIATVSQDTFFDTVVPSEGHHLYYVVATTTGSDSIPSNIVQAPSPAPPMTVARATTLLNQWANPDTEENGAWKAQLAHLNEELANENWGAAHAALETVRGEVQDEAVWPRWRVPDLLVVLDKLERRVELAERGLLRASYIRD